MVVGEGGVEPGGGTVQLPLEKKKESGMRILALSVEEVQAFLLLSYLAPSPLPEPLCIG
jgi:hypothetical protein